MKIFQSTRNTRPIIENNFRYICSDVPTVIAETIYRRISDMVC